MASSTDLLFPAGSMAVLEGGHSLPSQNFDESSDRDSLGVRLARAMLLAGGPGLSGLPSLGLGQWLWMAAEPLCSWRRSTLMGQSAPESEWEATRWVSREEQMPLSVACTTFSPSAWARAAALSCFWRLALRERRRVLAWALGVELVRELGVIAPESMKARGWAYLARSGAGELDWELWWELARQTGLRSGDKLSLLSPSCAEIAWLGSKSQGCLSAPWERVLHALSECHVTIPEASEGR